MAYVSGKFKTKKSLTEAVKNGEKVRVYSNSMFGGDSEPGTVAYVKMPVDFHKWYAQVKLDDEGYIAKIMS